MTNERNPGNTSFGPSRYIEVDREKYESLRDELTAARAEIARLKYERDDHKQAAWAMSGRPGRFSDHDDCARQSALLNKAGEALKLLLENHGDWIYNLPGATGLHDLEFARAVLLELETSKGSEGK